MQEPFKFQSVTSGLTPAKDLEIDADIKLLVLDIDGTIAGESNQIREPVCRAVQAAQAQGVQVAIATGRMYRSALRFHQAIGSTLPILAYQGALIQDPKTQHILNHKTVSLDLTEQLLDYFDHPDRRDRLSVHLYINDQLYVRDVQAETQSYAERSGVEPIPVGDLRQFLREEPTKVLTLCDRPSLVETLLHDLRQRYQPEDLYLTRSVSTFFEATNPQANKGEAVRYLAEEILGLRPNQVMAIGDNFNDLEMLTYAGIGVAMGNAPAKVQAIADWVAPDVESDGAVVAIEKFILK